MYCIRQIALPVIIEYLSISRYAHDVSLVRYLSKFPGSMWPYLSFDHANLLYILWSPLHDRTYGGRSTNIAHRHFKHCYNISFPETTNQIPAYFVLRDMQYDGMLAVATFFMLPVIRVNGQMEEAVAAERVFLGN